MKINILKLKFVVLSVLYKKRTCVHPGMIFVLRRFESCYLVISLLFRVQMTSISCSVPVYQSGMSLGMRSILGLHMTSQKSFGPGWSKVG